MSHIYHHNIDIIMKKGLNYKTYLRLVIKLNAIYYTYIVIFITMYIL